MPGYSSSWESRPGWPDAHEIPGLVADLTAEVRQVLDGWVLYNARGAGAAKAYTGAALWHCCELLRSIEENHDQRQEYVGRILTRALVECWFVALFLNYTGVDGLNEVLLSNRSDIRRQYQAIVEHNERLRRMRRNARRKSPKIEAHNRGIEAWNDQHPMEKPRPLLPLHQMPPSPDQDWPADILRSTPEVAGDRLNVAEVAQRLSRLTKSTENEYAFIVAYDRIYRGLSGRGAHPTFSVLDSYVEPRHHRSNVLTVQWEPHDSSLAQPDLESGLLFVAALSAEFLGKHGAPTPVARAVLARYNYGATLPGQPGNSDSSSSGV